MIFSKFKRLALVFFSFCLFSSGASIFACGRDFLSGLIGNQGCFSSYNNEKINELKDSKNVLKNGENYFSKQKIVKLGGCLFLVVENNNEVLEKKHDKESEKEEQTGSQETEKIKNLLT